MGNYPITVTLGFEPELQCDAYGRDADDRQKAASVTADDKTKTYGDDNPALTATVTGTVNGTR